jgi:cell division inhibitor SepF
MSNKFLNKMMGAIGLADEDEEMLDEDNLQEPEEEIYQQPEIINNRKNSKIVSIKSNSVPKVLLKSPSEFQDIMEIVDAVKSRRIVVMNINEVDAKLAQRMIDYIVGACYALNGEFQEITKSIYLIAPDNVEISNELKQELNRNGFFSFNER